MQNWFYNFILNSLTLSIHGHLVCARVWAVSLQCERSSKDDDSNFFLIENKNKKWTKKQKNCMHIKWKTWEFIGPKAKLWQPKDDVFVKFKLHAHLLWLYELIPMYTANMLFQRQVAACLENQVTKRTFDWISKCSSWRFIKLQTR